MTPGEILIGIKAKLELVTIANGFNTDAGMRVYVGREQFGRDDDYPVTSVGYLEDKREKTYSGTRRKLLSGAFDVSTLVEVDPENPQLAIDAAQADLKIALFGGAGDACVDLGLISWEYEGSTHYPRVDGDRISQITIRTTAQWNEEIGGARA